MLSRYTRTTRVCINKNDTEIIEESLDLTLF